MNKAILCLTALYACMTASAQMGKHIETDRPNETEVPYIVPRKYFQVEAGFRIEKKDEHEKTISYPAMLVKYGLSENVELRAKTSYSTLSRHYTPNEKSYSGLEPLEIGIKASILKEKKWIPKTALLLQTGIPRLSSRIFLIRNPAPVVRFLMENNVTEAFSFNYNVGVEWTGEGTTHQWVYTLTPGVDIGDHVHVFGELYSFMQRKESAVYVLDGGIEYFIGRNIGLDICSGFGIYTYASPYFFTMGGSVRF